MKRTWIITGQQARDAICSHVQSAPLGYCASLGISTRTLEQNAAQWPWLEGFAQQVEIPINGQPMKVDRDTWKEILTACYSGEQMRFATWGGQTILLPKRTSKMGVKRFAEWLEWLMAEAATNGVTPVFKSEQQEPERMAA